LPLAAITLYDISVFLHVTAVVVGFGSTFAESLMFPVALKLGSRYLPYVHRLQLAINQRFATPALAVVLVTGIYQVIEGRWSFASFWISATLAIVIALGALIGGYFIPTDRRLAPMVEAELGAAPGETVTLSAEYQRAARREGIAGGVAGVLIVVAIFLMVTKLGG
jgi:amino acid transporter